MTPLDGGSIEATAKAIDTVSKPSVFPVFIAVVCLFGCGYMVYENNKRVDAQLVIISKISERLDSLQRDVLEIKNRR
jgi:uncharacterized protein YutD